MTDAPYDPQFRKRAIREIVEAIANWYEHFGDERGPNELNRSLELICSHPYMGHVAPKAELQGVRRVLLRELRSHLYYLVDDEARTVTFLTLWHTSRGQGPGL